MKRIVLFLLFTALVASLMATDVSGVQSGTWTLINSPYNVVGEITVPATDSLVIEPGVDVIAMGNYKITLEGNLHAVATQADSIRFYGNGGLYWGGLRFENEDRASLLDYCRISNTDDTNDYGIHAINSPIYIDHCCIDDHKKAVHFSALATANPNYQEIRNSKVANCEQHGILITDNSNVLVDNCEVTQCGLGSTFRGAIQLALQNSNYGCSPVLSNNWIHHNGKQGLTMGNLFDDPGMAPTVTNNIIEYNLTGVYIYKAQGTYHGNIIRHNFIDNDPNSGAGVMLYGSSATGVFTQNQFYGNYCGIYLAMDATANLGDLNNASSDDDGMNEIHDNVFFNGTVYAINNTSASDVTAENNTWDSDDPTQIAVTIIDGNDDPAYGIVDFDPIYVQPTNGFISGNVGLSAGSGIIEDVIITAGTAQTSPAANGDFLLEVAPGTYDVEYALAYYDTIVVENVTVIAGQTTSGIDATLPVMLYPPRNLWYEVIEDVLVLHWDAPIYNPCLSINEYTVYLDGTVVGILPEVSYTFIDLPPGDYVAGVSAVYEDGWESDVITTPISFTPNLPSPGNLTATVFDYNDVALEWEPAGMNVLSHQSGYDNNGIGTGEPVDFTCAARFTSEDLTGAYGHDLSEIRIVTHSADFSEVTLCVWEGGSYGNPGTLIYNEDITNSVVPQEVTSYTLTTPVTLTDGNEYWIGYEISATGDHPAAVDAGPVVPDKGAWIYFDGVWSTLLDLGATLDFNWCIDGIVSFSDGATASISPRAINKSLRGTDATADTITSAHPARSQASRARTTRAIEGYKIYRNDEMIHEITDPATTTYNDMGLDGGDYSYHVTAVYTGGESEPGNTQELTITLGAPQNFNAVSQGPNQFNIMCTWSAPAQTRNITKYRVYNDGELIGETTTTFFVWVNPPNITYDLYCTAVYSDLYESPESNHVTINSHASGIIPAVTRLTGNYPNPFNPTTSISFDLAQAEHASLVVYNAKGEVVATLLDADMPAGSHSIHWDGTIDNASAGSGIYFYQLRTADYTQTRRMVLLK